MVISGIDQIVSVEHPSIPIATQHVRDISIICRDHLLVGCPGTDTGPRIAHCTRQPWDLSLRKVRERKSRRSHDILGVHKGDTVLLLAHGQEAHRGACR